MVGCRADGGLVQLPSTRIWRGSASERSSAVYTSDCEGVMSTHELIGALLPFSGKVTIGEMVAVEALIGSGVGAVEDGEGEAQ